MTSGSSSTKRPRTDDKGASDEITKSKYWFDDGNIILQAESTQFKVHRSLLANQSIVFRDMFSMPQLAPLDPLLDGCPVVPLSDKAQDIELVMSIFYDNFRAHDMRELMPFRLVAAILRFGKKYQVDHLQAEGLQRLRNEFPKDLKSWDVCYSKVVQLDDVKPNIESIINLAHELSVPTILPAAYLRYLNMVDIDGILHGRKLDEEDGEGGSETVRLVEKALHQSVMGRDKLIRKFLGISKDWLTKPGIIPSRTCIKGSLCSNEKTSAILNLRAMNFQYLAILDPWSRPTASTICKNCATSLDTAFNLARAEIWNNLPSYFDLGSWGELTDFA